LNSILQDIQSKTSVGKKMLSVLIDPDKIKSNEELYFSIEKIEEARADYIFFGGSLLAANQFEKHLKVIKKISKIPVVIFPGSVAQISGQADGILFLSLISGRNPELLIGNQVIAAPIIKDLKIEPLPTGYLLIDCGNVTTAIYMSGSMPIPEKKADVAAATALAGEMLGLKLIYLDGGSGAQKPVNNQMIGLVKSSIKIPLIVGGGINTAEKALGVFDAGADMIVIGNGFEKSNSLLEEIVSSTKHL
jgi:phosphoglycerol geranylgeranyltransferase